MRLVARNLILGLVLLALTCEAAGQCAPPGAGPLLWLDKSPSWLAEARPNPDGAALFLVHGWQPDDLPPHDAWKALGARLKSEGLLDRYEPMEVRYLSNRVSANQLAAELAEKLLPEARQRDVVIVAHSMGGLLARAALSKLRAQEPEAAARIRAIIALGTPNRGTPFANRSVGVPEAWFEFWKGLSADCPNRSDLRADRGWLGEAPNTWVEDLNSDRSLDGRLLLHAGRCIPLLLDPGCWASRRLLAAWVLLGGLGAPDGDLVVPLDSALFEDGGVHRARYYRLHEGVGHDALRTLTVADVAEDLRLVPTLGAPPGPIDAWPAAQSSVQWRVRGESPHIITRALLIEVGTGRELARSEGPFALGEQSHVSFPSPTSHTQVRLRVEVAGGAFCDADPHTRILGPVPVPGFCVLESNEILVRVAGAPKLEPAAPDFGLVAPGTVRDRLLSLTNGGPVPAAGTVTVAPPFMLLGGSTLTVPGNGTRSIPVRFAPATSGHFARDLTFNGVKVGTLTGQATVAPPPSGGWPAKPAGLTVTPGGSTPVNEFRIDWTNPSHSVALAKVWFKLGTPPTSPTDGIAYDLPTFKPFTVRAQLAGGQDIHVWLQDALGKASHVNRATGRLLWDDSPGCPPIVGPTISLPATDLDGDYALNWNNLSNATSYEIQESLDTSFAVIRTFGTRTPGLPVYDRAPDRYSYRVRGVNECSAGPWSSPATVEVLADYGPLEPTSFTPAADATGVSRDVTLSWQGGHGGGEAVRFDVYVCRGLGVDCNRLASAGQTGTTYALSGLGFGEDVTWKVVARDNSGDSATSPILHFRTLQDSGPPIGSISINDGAATTTSRIVSLSLAANDSGSGVAYMRFSHDGQNWTSWEAFALRSRWLLEQGGGSNGRTFRAYVQFRDASGNDSTPVSDTIELASSAPGTVHLNGTRYDSVRAALRAAQPGDVVFLGEGTFLVGAETEPPRFASEVVGWVLKPGVTLSGAGPDRTFVTSTEVGLAIVDADDAVIQGLTISAQRSGFSADAIRLESARSSVRDVVVRDSHQGVVVDRYTSPTRPSANRLSGLVVVNSERGVYLWGSGTTVEHATIALNTEGLYAVETNATVRNVIVAQNTTGISNSSNVALVSSNVFGNGQDYSASHQTGVRGNISADPRFAGSGDFRLLAGSPSIDSGTNTGQPFTGSAPDQGAFEYGAIGSVQVTTNQPAATFRLVGPDAVYQGGGTAWSQTSIAEGFYALEFGRVENLQTPATRVFRLGAGQTINVEALYGPDTEPPLAEVEIAGGRTSTRRAQVDVLIRASDALSDLLGGTIELSHDGLAWSPIQPFTSRTTWALEDGEPGARTVFVRVTDASGNSLVTYDDVLFEPERVPLAVPDAYGSISEALASALPGDTVWLAPGEYQEGTTLEVPTGVRLQGAGPGITRITFPRAGGPSLNLQAAAEVDGLEVPWVACASGRPAISNAVVTYGLSIEGGCHPSLRNNVFRGTGVSITGDEAQRLLFENNLFWGVDLGSIRVNTSAPNQFEIRNNVFLSNAAGIVNDVPGPRYELAHNVFWDTAGDELRGGVEHGPGDRTVDPLLLDPANGLFLPAPGSPLIDQGDPDSRHDDVDGSRSDIGIGGGRWRNSVPIARLEAQPPTVSLGGVVLLDANGTSDAESLSDSLEYRWDLDGDGAWDGSFEQGHALERAVFDSLGSYTVRVQVRDQGGFVGEAATVVVVTNRLPETPARPVPEEGAQVPGPIVQLGWQSFDPDYADAVHFDVYLGRDGVRSRVAQALDVTEFEVRVDAGTAYTWQIVARDSSGAEAPGPIWSFSVAADPLPVITVRPGSVREMDAGNAAMRFAIEFDRPAPGPVQVTFNTAAITAQPNEDFEPRSETLDLPTGATQGFIEVVVLGDVEVEEDETLAVTVAVVSGARVSADFVVGTILDDDGLDADWSSHQGSSTRAGATTGIGPRTPESRWSLATSTATPPVVRKDGTILFLDSGRYLRLVDASGRLASSAGPFDGNFGASPAMGSDGSVYFAGSHGGQVHTLYGVESDGTFRWEMRLDTFSGDGLAVGKGLVFASEPKLPFSQSDGSTVAFDASIGTLRWSQLEGFRWSRAPAFRGEDVYVAGCFTDSCSGGVALRARDAETGALRWEQPREQLGGNIRFTAPSVSADGTVYVFTGARLVAVTPAGEILWSVAVDVPAAASPYYSSPATADTTHGRIVYLARGSNDGTAGPVLMAYSGLGQLLWSTTLASDTCDRRTPVVGVDAEGVAYVTYRTSSGTCATGPFAFAVDPAGTILWSRAGATSRPGALSAGGMLYVSLGGALEAIGRPLPSLSATADAANEGDVDVRVAVRLSEIAQGATTVRWATGAGSAVPGEDYGNVSGTLVFLPGEREKEVAIPLIDDARAEDAESFSISFADPVGATLEAASLSLTIQDDDPQPALSVMDAQGGEGSDLEIEVSLGSASGQAIDVHVDVTPGSATEGADYQTPSATTLEFAPGVTRKTLRVRLIQDALDEGVETIEVHLSSPRNASVQQARATGTILDDDPQPSIHAEATSVLEGQAGTSEARVAVRLSEPSGREVSVTVRTQDGTATAGSDYLVVPATSLSFPAGETSGTIAVPILGDLVPEGNETLMVALASAVNADLADTEAVITILDDEGPAVLGPSMVSPGEVAEARVVNGPGNALDWLALVAVGAADTAHAGNWLYLNCTKTAPSSGRSSATCPFTMPTIPGTYEFRLFANNGYLRLATSNSISVATPPTPVIGVTPPSLEFGPVSVGQAKDLPVTVTNIGGGTLTGIASTSGAFSVAAGGAYSLGPGQSQTVTVRFAPTSVAGYTGSLALTGGGGVSLGLIGEGTPIPDASLLLNGSMEVDDNADRVPDGWKGAGMAVADGRASDAAFSGSYAFKFVSNGKVKKLTQVVAVTGSANARLRLGFWHTTQSVSGRGAYYAKVTLLYTDGTRAAMKVNLAGGSHAWERLELPISAKKAFKKVTVLFQYGKANGKVWLDDVVLVRE